MNAIGRILIGAGVLVLLFAIFQLWGTSLQHSQAQGRLSNEFEDRLAAIADLENALASTTTTAIPSDEPEHILPGNETDAPDDPNNESDQSEANGQGGGPGPENESPEVTEEIDPAILEALRPVEGEPVARIVIPSIGVDEIVVHGVSVADLRKGPGHYPDSPMPGQSGNAAIAGHRTTYGQPFHNLDLLSPGDLITVYTLQGQFTYEVMSHPGDTDQAELGYFIVPETGVEVLEDSGDNRLTLTACHPKFSSRQRIVVTALLTDNPEPALPPTTTETTEPTDTPATDIPEEPQAAMDFGEGLGGDSDALVPALAWGGLFLMALGAAIYLGRRWKRWASYLLASPVLVVLLYYSFMYLDQYLPSY